ncbi:MAG: hypothetical protein GY711_31580 [bacterium]|nr:hypothetical protein [bacterium]
MNPPETANAAGVRTSVLRFVTGALALCATALPATAQIASDYFPQRNPASAAFAALETETGPYIDLLFAPVRPLAWNAPGTRLLALNTHDSELRHYDASHALLGTARVPWGPVAVAHWSDDAQPPGPANRFALVVSRGNYVLSRVHLPSGRVAGIVPLRTEPADIVVHPGSNHAFVSCPGADVVLEIDVSAGVVVREYAIPAREPTFLALEGANVLVAPMASGNNSTADRGTHMFDAGPGRVLDLDDPAVATRGLSDRDLFRITPGVDAAPVALGLGTVLFAIGVNPATQATWVLNTEANNKDPQRMGEPAVRGEFLFNRLTTVQLPAGPAAPVGPAAILELDDSDPATPGIQYDSTRTVGQPYALDFDGGGHGYVVGLLTDNVTELDENGAFVREFDVGSIPRAVLAAPDGETLWVHCWGDNTVEVYDLSGPVPNRTATLDLGYDPTPALEAEGRRVFFDGQFSMHGNASCNSCHIEAQTDMLVWDLSDLPRDDKGPMVTQTLRGIADLVPLHWRGERDGMIDFNGAFDGLLGSAPLDTSPGGDFEAFQAYLDSLHQPANPNEHPRRIVDGHKPVQITGGSLLPANAVRGQRLFLDEINHRCNVCHTLPTGTANDTFNDESGLQIPRRNHFVVPSFNGMWRKTQPTIETIILANGTVDTRPTTGAGVTQAGLINGTFEFVSNSLFELSAQEAADVTAFLSQADSGLAPATHQAFHMDASNAAPFTQWTTGPPFYLLEEARKKHVDIVVMGRVYFPLGTPLDLRWFYDHTIDRFRAESSDVPPMPLQFFAQQALVFGDAINTFIGVPRGMGERFGVDFDNDDLYNADETFFGLDPFDPDSDGDGFPDGHEYHNNGDPRDQNVLPTDTTPPTLSDVRLVYKTTRVAKFQLEADEPVRWQVTWTGPAGAGARSGTRFAKTHSVLVTELERNAPYNFIVAGIDHAGLTSMQVLPAFTTDDHLAGSDSVLAGLTQTILQDSSGTLRVRLDGIAERKDGGALADRRLVVQVSVGDTITHPTVYGGNTSTSNGAVMVEVTQNNLSVGDDVDIMVFTLFDTVRNTSTSWDMAATSPENRGLRIPYTGNGP